MSSQEEKDKHNQRRKRNIYAKVIRDHKGPFKPKVIDARKQEYKRVKLRPVNIESDNYDEGQF